MSMTNGVVEPFEASIRGSGLTVTLRLDSTPDDERLVELLTWAGEKVRDYEPPEQAP